MALWLGKGNVLSCDPIFNSAPIASVNVTLFRRDGVGVNTVNHVSGRCDVESTEERGFGFPMPRHSRPLFITDLTPHDGYILLSLIVMKCKPSPEVGDNWGSSYGHCIFWLLSLQSITWDDRGPVKEGARTEEAEEGGGGYLGETSESLSIKWTAIAFHSIQNTILAKLCGLYAHK